MTTESVEERILKHNESAYGSRYTSKTKDWKLFHKIECQTVSQMTRIEKHIKRMKSREYLLNLKRYPDIETKLLERYRGI